MTNDPDLCSQDERWSNLTCDITFGSGQYPGERCTSGCGNYCFYPHGLPEDLSERDKSIMRTTCDCVSTVSSEDVSTASSEGVSITSSEDVNTASSTVIIVVILVIVIIAAVGGVYYDKKKQQQDPSHEALAEATQETEMGKM